MYAPRAVHHHPHEESSTMKKSRTVRKSKTTLSAQQLEDVGETLAKWGRFASPEIRNEYVTSRLHHGVTYWEALRLVVGLCEILIDADADGDAIAHTRRHSIQTAAGILRQQLGFIDLEHKRATVEDLLTGLNIPVGDSDDER